MQLCQYTELFFNQLEHMLSHGQGYAIHSIVRKNADEITVALLLCSYGDTFLFNFFLLISVCLYQNDFWDFSRFCLPFLILMGVK